MAITIAAVNRKGGVGKTSTLFHLAGHFARQGYRVLLVDNDPQHSLTAGLLGVQAADALPRGNTIAALFDDRYDPAPEEIIRPTPIERIHILPGSDGLTAFNLPGLHDAGARQLALRDLVQEVSGLFDLILIDNPPNIQLCTWAALAASRFALVPFQPEDYGCQGAAAIQKAIADVQRTVNPSLRLTGFLLNMVKPRLAIHRAYEELLRRLYGAAVFTTMLPDSTDYKVAISERRPVTQYKPRSAAAQAVKALAEEILARVQADAAGRARREVA